MVLLVLTGNIQDIGKKELQKGLRKTARHSADDADGQRTRVRHEAVEEHEADDRQRVRPLGDGQRVQ